MQEFSTRDDAETLEKSSSNETQRALSCLERAGRLWGSTHSWLSVEPTKLGGTQRAARRCLEQAPCLWTSSRWLVVESEKVAASREIARRCLKHSHQLLSDLRCRLSLETSRWALARVGQLPGASWLPSGQAALEFVLLQTLLVVSFIATKRIAYLPDAGLIDREWQLWALLVISPLITAAGFCLVAPDVVTGLRTNTTAVFLPAVNYTQAVSNVFGLAYGIHVSNESVLAMNMLGFAAQILCLVVVHYIRAPSDRLFCFAVKFSLGWIVLLYVATTTLDITVIGPVMAFFGTVAGVLPLAYLGPILRNRSCTKWGMFCMCSSFCVNFAWSLLGFMLQDMALLLPSIICMEIAVLRISVGLWCWGWLPFNVTFLLRIYGLERIASDTVSATVPPETYGMTIDLEEI